MRLTCARGVMTFHIAAVFVVPPGDVLLVVAAVGARIGLRIYRQEEAILQLERLDGCVRTRVAGPTGCGLANGR